MIFEDLERELSDAKQKEKRLNDLLASTSYKGKSGDEKAVIIRQWLYLRGYVAMLKKRLNIRNNIHTDNECLDRIKSEFENCYHSLIQGDR